MINFIKEQIIKHERKIIVYTCILLIFLIMSILLVLSIGHIINKSNEINNNHSTSIDFTNPPNILNKDETRFSIKNEHEVFLNKIVNFKHLDYVIFLTEKYEIDYRIILCIIWQESRFDSSAISPTGAKGLMQLTNYVYGKYSEFMDPHNEIQNLFLGITYFNYLYDKYYFLSNKRNRLKVALAAYNGGLKSVQDAAEINDSWIYEHFYTSLPYETKDYVNKILFMYEKFED